MGSDLTVDGPTPQVVFDRMAGSFQADKAGRGTIEMTIQVALSGENGGNWWIRVADGKCTVDTGVVTSSNLTLVADAGDYVKVRLGQLDPIEAYKAGRLKFKGKGSLPMAFRMLSLFRRSS